MTPGQQRTADAVEFAKRICAENSGLHWKYWPTSDPDGERVEITRLKDPWTDVVLHVFRRVEDGEGWYRVAPPCRHSSYPDPTHS